MAEQVDKGEKTFERELASLINKHRLDTEAQTPDYILAQFFMGCYNAFRFNAQARDDWFGNDSRIKYTPEESTHG